MQRVQDANQRFVRLPRPTDRIPLGQTGLMVSPFCLGMAGKDAVLAAHDAGVNFFFLSADMHWPEYNELRKGIEHLLENGVRRDDIVVAVVTYVAQPEFLWLPVREVINSVRGLERADVIVIGGAYASDWMSRHIAVANHRHKGTLNVRGTGASFHDRLAAANVIRGDHTDIAYVRYNAGHTGAQHEIFPAARCERRCLIYNFKSLGGFVAPATYPEQLGSDYWRPSPADHYRYVLSAPEIDGILCALESPREVRELLDGLDRGPLGEDEQRYMENLYLVSTGRAQLADKDL